MIQRKFENHKNEPTFFTGEGFRCVIVISPCQIGVNRALI